jgi:hypothetical protein
MAHIPGCLAVVRVQGNIIMRYILCGVIGTLFLLGGGAGCNTKKKPEVTIPSEMYDLPPPPSAAGSGIPKKSKPPDEQQPKKDKEEPPK